MKKVYNRRVYDTDTARRVYVAQASNASTKQPVNETLYLSPNNQLFMFVTTRFQNVAVEFRVYGRQQALAWLETVDAPVEAYEAAGFEIEEG